MKVVLQVNVLFSGLFCFIVLQERYSLISSCVDVGGKYKDFIDMLE